MFVLKIQKLEKLCRVLQDERKVLYDKIKEVRQANSNLPSKIFAGSKLSDETEGADKPALLTPEEIQELQEEDLVLTEDMARLREQQAKLQVFADSLLAPAADNEEEDNDEIDLEEDLVASAFIQFKSKPQVKEELVPVPEEQAVEKVKEVQKPAVSTPEKNTSEMIPTDPKPEAVKVQPQVEAQEVEQVKPNEIQQQQSAEQEPSHEAEKVRIDPPTDLKPEPEVNVQTQIEDKEVQQVKADEEIQQQKQQHPEQNPAAATEKVTPLTDAQPEAAEAKIQEETGEVKLVGTEEDEKVQQLPAEPLQVATEAPTTSESASPSEKTAESSTKQVPKKKKKKGGKNAS